LKGKHASDYLCKMKNIDIANNLKVARAAANLTQEELADLVGVARQTIGLIEAGKYNPSLKLCLLIARFTGKSLNELFWEEE
jgi:putative transcriptional regulator